MIIEINNLTFQYSGTETPSLININLKISKGEFVLITGKSGCGKTTLIRTFNGLIPHFYGGTLIGTVKVCGLDTIFTNTKIFAGKVGYVFQNSDNQLFMSNVERELAFGMENLAIDRSDMIGRINKVLNALEIEKLRNRELSSLSGGEKQKIAIASILCMQPEIIVLDEPTSELDPKSATEIIDLIMKIHNELNITIIIVEHRLEKLIQKADRLIVMDKGLIIQDGKPQEILKQAEIPNLSFALIRLFNKVKKNFNIPDKENAESYPLSINDAEKFYQKLFERVNLSSKGLHNSITIQKDIIVNPNMDPIIEIKGVSYDYSAKLNALRNINVSMRSGEFIGIIGNNGSGKTTLLKLLMGLLKPKTGNILIDGHDIKEKSIAKLSKTIGLMFQNPGIQFYRDTLKKEYYAIVNNYIEDTNEIEPRINDMFTLFDLAKYSETYPKYLSMGELQKAALGSVLISKPKILALDEPTHGMDYDQKYKFFQFLETYRSQGNLIIVVTHDIELLSRFVNRVIILENGEIIADGEKHDILTRFLSFSPIINQLIKRFPSLPQNILNEDELMEVISDEKK